MSTRQHPRPPSPARNILVSRANQQSDFFDRLPSRSRNAREKFLLLDDFAFASLPYDSCIGNTSSIESKKMRYYLQRHLYEEEDLGPVEEIESDRQQRVYRGQPPTLGQVARDRDGIVRHANALQVCDPD